ncbi:LytR family transcriptional regulator [Maribacter sp. 4U21]|uniref:LytR/AlgR family response regulator transcription factor n=1 Tax=Maribacter sp. 4U21 TaxID=1889779 RepID=UPI000C1475AE|nr:LytTR family DNA-binding domain-containing protein [Maribacter sp. 4U21]PIB23821.1 LytR family transcriptional regulator [Maribacter sp. 4U21]
MEYNYSIIDSDAVSNLQLQAFLDEYGDFSCVGNLKSPSDGLNNILKYTPDIIFVNLNDKASALFQMVVELHQYVTTVPLVIGISKTKEHAYEAIKNNFFDYWLLPYNEFDIRKSLLKLRKKLPKEATPQTICLKSYNDFQYLDTTDILYLQADNNTTEFHMIGGNVTHAYKTLKTFEKQLPKNFVRIHQSYIVNTDYVSRINFGKSICALKKNNKSLPFSKTYRENMDNLKKILSQNSVSNLN